MSGARTVAVIASVLALSLLVGATAAVPAVDSRATSDAVVKIYVTRTIAQSCSYVVPLRRVLRRIRSTSSAPRVRG